MNNSVKINNPQLESILVLHSFSVHDWRFGASTPEKTNPILDIPY